MNGKWVVLVLVIGGLFAQSVCANADLEKLRERIKEEMLDKQPDDAMTSKLMETLSEDGTWSDINYEDRSRTGFQHVSHVVNLQTMALSLSHPSSKYHNDEALEQHILLALQHWLDEDYIASNWHTNEIANPTRWLEILFLLEGHLEEDQQEGVAALAARGNLGAWGARPGGDLIKIAGIEATLSLFERDKNKFQNALRAMIDEVGITSGMGIKPDLGFHHRADRVTSILSYGRGYAATFADWALRLEGTSFQFPEESTRLLVDYYLDGIAKSMVHASYKDPGVTNRDMAREGNLKPFDASLPKKLLAITDYRRDELEDIIAIRDEGKKPDLSHNSFFWFSEYASHQRPGYFTSVRMHSERNNNMEAPHNGESLKMHHHADGSNFISRTGKEYYDIFPVWDWQKIPGTTILQKPTHPPSSEIVKKGKSEFVGAVTDGQYGAVVFDFISPHDPLKAKKSWFFFDEGYACLGAGISSEEILPVFTTINQALLEGEIYFGKSGSQHKLEENTTISETMDWVWHDSVAYVFYPATEVKIQSKEATGKWEDIVETQRVRGRPALTKKLFSIWIDHGKQPQGASYAYKVIPGISMEDAKSLSPFSDIHMLSNTEGLQAVYHSDLQKVSVVAYQAGEFELPNGNSFSVSSPSALLLQLDGGNIASITVSDPSRKGNQLEIQASFSGHGDFWSAENGKIRIHLPKGDRAGSSVSLVNGTKEGQRPDWEFSEDSTFGKPGEKDAAHYIGKEYGGGVIVWLDESGEHGLIVAKSDQHEGIAWRNGRAEPPQLYGDHGDRMINAVRSGIYAGKENTAVILPQYTADDIYGDFAAKVCSRCQDGGYGDWYLPSKDELDMLYQWKDELGGFDSDLYWSSTEYNIGFVWGQNFSGYGGQFTQNKGSRYAVRCIRKF
ncbi:polysaccharide lyase family 8 super-sandwich domain-containing protein [Pleomorphovibrio marinus]|uniref:polysaccharide lyase family 8 super-sandwich domain-containing protein n=1 Tax=Pleomorphovibrio marinus TaxID=2164132 RepID=UPI000E0BEF7D|nr:polysaccharide lyase family 8 super-sandwich domain-containing protein [Pleomorphovibrio marinus]